MAIQKLIEPHTLIFEVKFFEGKTSSGTPQ
jgi:hypothetical protein